ncbi:helix-turn-helix transcriptional regulator [Vibrio spartinae]|uniref:Transcriptional activator protein LasR n=1 Tax=Vibrio spartinae TaxID=1918945 RepID=A0A1N6M935_9VIBR|nr:LuxR C-terminal-related transcriptional regulator [Vibrio spartinae]SIO95962.1 Transcriptional activator protein LasR [Vibrio spartinae]
MDKLKLFELSNQLRCVESSDSIHVWFSELQNEISFEFSILTLFDNDDTPEPICYGFSSAQFTNCFSKNTTKNDPLTAVLQHSNSGIITLMDSHTHPDYGRRLLLASYYGNKKSIYLTSFGDRQPSCEEINVLYLLTPHLNMVLNKVSDHKTHLATYFPPENQLTSRENELLSWLKIGKSNWEIGRLLNINECTVKYHLQNIYRKLGVHNRTHAVSRATELGLN